MLIGCRHICVAWAAIGLLTLATGIAAGLGDLMRVGAFALVAFGTLRLAMASDDFGLLDDWLAARRGSAPAKGPRTARGFLQRPAPYVLVPLTGFVVLVGRVLMLTKPSLGEDARLLILGIMVGTLTLTVVYLWLLAVEGAHATAAADPQPSRDGAAPRPSAVDAISGLGALDTTSFTREVLDVDRSLRSRDAPQPRGGGAGPAGK
jgi:hypothetical protein